MPILENAIAIALQVHRGQVDKAGQPYILHPLRVMLSLDSDLDKIVAVLHDIVDDSNYKIADLKKKEFPDEVLHALDCLTKRQGESYDEFIERIKTNPIATRVKIADLEDNMEIHGLISLTDKDLQTLKRYRDAWAKLKLCSP